MIQIQPIFNIKEDYEALAESQGLFYEALELSFDGVSPEKRAWYENCGRVKSFHGAFIDVNPGSSDGEIRTLSERKYRQSCDQALRCGAENVVFHSTCATFLRGGYLDMWAGRCADFFEQLSDEYRDLHIFIENSFDIDPTPIKELMNRISSKNVGVCLDIGHINYSGTPEKQWFDVLGERTGYLHLSDNMGIFDDHLPIGKGIVDWREIKKRIACLPLSSATPATLEVGGMDNIKESLVYMRELGIM